MHVYNIYVLYASLYIVYVHVHVDKYMYVHIYMYIHNGQAEQEITVRHQTFSDHFMLLFDQRTMVCHYI